MSACPCMCVCSCVCVLVCVRFSNNFTLKFVTNCSYNENLHKISICVFVMLPLPLPLPRSLPAHRFRFNFATICIKCAARASLTNFTCRRQIYELLKIFTGYFLVFFWLLCLFFLCSHESHKMCALRVVQLAPRAGVNIVQSQPHLHAPLSFPCAAYFPLLPLSPW